MNAHIHVYTEQFRITDNRIKRQYGFKVYNSTYRSMQLHVKMSIVLISQVFTDYYTLPLGSSLSEAAYYY